MLCKESRRTHRRQVYVFYEFNLLKITSTARNKTTPAQHEKNNSLKHSQALELTKMISQHINKINLFRATHDNSHKLHNSHDEHHDQSEQGHDGTRTPLQVEVGPLVNLLVAGAHEHAETDDGKDSREKGKNKVSDLHANIVRSSKGTTQGGGNTSKYGGDDDQGNGTSAILLAAVTELLSAGVTVPLKVAVPARTLESQLPEANVKLGVGLVGSDPGNVLELIFIEGVASATNNEEDSSTKGEDSGGGVKSLRHFHEISCGKILEGSLVWARRPLRILTGKDI